MTRTIIERGKKRQTKYVPKRERSDHPGGVERGGAPAGFGETEGWNDRQQRAKIEMPQRRAIALELRRTGSSYRTIAEATGVSVRQAYYDVQEELRTVGELRRELAEEVLEQELERLDRGLELLEPAAAAGDVAAIAEMRRYGESRRKLLGLDAPTKVAQTTPDGEAVDFSRMSDAQIAERLSVLLVKVGERDPRELREEDPAGSPLALPPGDPDSADSDVD